MMKEEQERKRQEAIQRHRYARGIYFKSVTPCGTSSFYNGGFAKVMFQMFIEPKVIVIFIHISIEYQTLGVGGGLGLSGHY